METNLSEEPPSQTRLKNTRCTKIYDFFRRITTLFRGWFCGDVPCHSKNLLDFKRPIVRSGPLSIF